MSSFSPSVPAPAPEGHRRGDSGWKSGRSIAYAALAIALIATVVDVAAWLRPTHEKITFSDQQTAQAKKDVCLAALVVNKAAFARKPRPNPADLLAQVGEADTAHLALLGGGAYLRDTVAAQPAAPADLATAANSRAQIAQQVGINTIAGTATPAALNSLQQNLNTAMGEINKICGFNP